MNGRRRQSGFTVLELVFAVTIISLLAVIYFVMIDAYTERRMSEQAAKVLMQAARVQEKFFTATQQYFDADVSGNGGSAYLTTPDGRKTDVKVPASVVLSMKASGPDRRSFEGYAFYIGGEVLHKYDSNTGKIVTVKRGQDKTG